MPTTNSCLRCHSEFNISDHHLEFLTRAAPHLNGKALTFSKPRFCPTCRDRGRLAWRNDRSLYARQCSLCNKRVISCYSPISGFTVYCSSCFNSDKWDPLDYGLDYNSDVAFLDQFQKLLTSIPHLALYNIDHENSEYCNHAANMKDCYLVFASALNEKTLYATRTWKNQSCVDIVECSECEACYSILDCHNSYQLFSSTHCTHCSDSAFLFDCHSCQNCFGSANLRQAQYVMFNQQLSKAEYSRRISELQLGNYSSFKNISNRFDQHLKKQIHRHAFMTNCEDCSGDQLAGCKDSTYCFNLSGAEDCHFCELGFSPKDCYDASGISTGELCYGAMNHLGSNRSCSGVVTYYNENCHYIYHCQSCKDSLGTVGLRQKQYAILNKLYSRSEYERILEDVSAQMTKAGIWGEFFPGSLSPFGYNETEAQSIFPLSQKDAFVQGFSWSDFTAPSPSASKTIKAERIPDNLASAGAEILDWVVLCASTDKPFKIMKSELDFHKIHGLPLPRLHPDERYKALLARRNSRRLFERQCLHCKSDIISSYNPKTNLKVVCEKCYREEVFGS